MADLQGILGSRDFLVNLAAGLVIFVAEVALIALLLPKIVERRLARKWEPARLGLVWLLAETASELEKYWSTAMLRATQWVEARPDLDKRNDAWAGLAKVQEEARTALNLRLAQIGIYGPALTPAMAGLVSEYIRVLGELGQLSLGGLHNPAKGSLVYSALQWDELLALVERIGRETTAGITKTTDGLRLEIPGYGRRGTWLANSSYVGAVGAESSAQRVENLRKAMGFKIN